MLNVDITGLCLDVTKVLYLIAVVRFYLTLSIFMFISTSALVTSDFADSDYKHKM